MSKKELMEQYTAEQMAEKILEYEEENEKLNADARKWYQECQQHRKVYQTICRLEDLQSENVRLEKEYAEALKRLEERQEKIKELESKQYDGILFISVDGKPKAYTEETLCKMAKVYEDLKYCKEHEGEHLHSEEHLMILNLNRTISELQSEVDKYRKAFEDAKKEHDCQISEYRKKIEELENHHKFSMMQIDDVLVNFLGVTHEVMDNPRDFEKVLQELVNKDKSELERAKNTINQIDDILEKLFGVRHDAVKFGGFEQFLREKVMEKVSDFLPTEPIKIADMLISAKGECEPFPALFGNEEIRDTYRIFNIEELKQIAEHLLIYCNANKEQEHSK